jgi:hypothetical protein
MPLVDRCVCHGRDRGKMNKDVRSEVSNQLVYDFTVGDIAGDASGEAGAGCSIVSWQDPGMGPSDRETLD